MFLATTTDILDERTYVNVSVSLEVEDCEATDVPEAVYVHWEFAEEVYQSGCAIWEGKAKDERGEDYE